MSRRPLAAMVTALLATVLGAGSVAPAPGRAATSAGIWPWADICTQGEFTSHAVIDVGVKLAGWVRACPGQDKALVARARHGLAVYKTADDGRVRGHVLGTRTLESATEADDFRFGLPGADAGWPVVAVCLVDGADDKSRLDCLAVEHDLRRLRHVLVRIPTDDPRVSGPVTDLVEDGRGRAPFCGDCLWSWPRICAEAAFTSYHLKESSLTLQGWARACPGQEPDRVQQARYGLAIYRTNADGTRTGYLFGTRTLGSGVNQDQFTVYMFDTQPDWPTEALCLVDGPGASSRLACLAIVADPVLLEPSLVPIPATDGRVDAPIGWVIRDGIGATPFCGSCV